MTKFPISPLVALRGLVLIVISVLAAGLVFSWPPIPQDPAYHHFADDRAWLGIPNFANVVSNLPFLIIGTIGCWYTCCHHSQATPAAFLTREERWPYLILFLGVGLTAFGSAYYHWAPDNARLVWDRLPMTVAFMGLFSSLLNDWLHPKLGTVLLLPAVLVGGFSVFYWERHDDLRPYVLVQFYPLLIFPVLVLLFPARWTGTGYLFTALACYAAAKVCEHPYDEAIYQALGQTISGHTAKHLLAALAVYWVWWRLHRRRPVNDSATARVSNSVS